MIKDIISFCIKDCNLAVDLQDAPIILTASKYIPSESKSVLPLKIEFEQKEVNIINHYNDIDLRIDKISDSTKILVGEIDDKMFGLLVDKVLGIVNISDKIDKKNLNKPGDKIVVGETVLSNEKFKIIDLLVLAKNEYNDRKILNNNHLT